MSEAAATRLSTRSIAITAGVSVASGALLVLLLVRLIQAGSAVDAAPKSPLVGHPAPAFTITTWNDPSAQAVRLAQFAGRPVVVNFWASWCAQCGEEQSVLNAAWQKYQAQGVEFVGIAYNDKAAEGSTYLHTQHVGYPSGPPTQDTVPIDYSVTAAPETVFINRDGVVVDKFIGPIDDGTLAREIQQILK
ncbi:MAG: TlpA family protein disulfide reductase [Ktedonobacterales bacterium]